MTMKPSGKILLVLAVGAGLSSCAPQEQADFEEVDALQSTAPTQTGQTRLAQAQLIDSEGGSAGTITFIADGPDRLQIRGTVSLAGAQPGMKGFHVHEDGECDPPNFESAGAHFSPHGDPHGGPHHPPDSRHTGDLGNVYLDDEGRLDIDLVDSVITLDEGPDQVLGRAVIVHAGEDDMTTQPDGDAGDPIACGIIEAAEE